MDKHLISGRRRARKLVLQALYQWHMAGGSSSEIELQFRLANASDKINFEYFNRILYGVIQNITQIDAALTPFLDRSFKSLNPIELSVLRLGAYELLFCIDIPYKVVLDESISLAKTFGSQDGHRYVNGVLNKLAKSTREIEVKLENE